MTYEPTNIFAGLRPRDGQELDYRRPDILVHNPYGGGGKVIIEVAVTATNGQTRTSYYDTSRPLKVRYDQKIQKYANAAHAVGCRLIPCVLSHAGPIQHEIEDFVRGQIRQKLQIADDRDDPTKLKPWLNIGLNKCQPQLIGKQVETSIEKPARLPYIYL